MLVWVLVGGWKVEVSKEWEVVDWFFYMLENEISWWVRCGKDKVRGDCGCVGERWMMGSLGVGEEGG